MKNLNFFNSHRFIFQQATPEGLNVIAPCVEQPVGQPQEETVNPDAPADAAEREAADMLKKSKAFSDKMSKSKEARRAKTLEALGPQLQNFTITVERQFEMTLKRGTPQVDKNVEEWKEMNETRKEWRNRRKPSYSISLPGMDDLSAEEQAKEEQEKKDNAEWEKGFRKNPVITNMKASDVAEIDPSQVAGVKEIPAIVSLTYTNGWPEHSMGPELIEKDPRWSSYLQEYDTGLERHRLQDKTIRFNGSIPPQNVLDLDREIDALAAQKYKVTVKTTVIDR